MTIEELYDKIGSKEDGVKYLKTRESRYTEVGFFVKHYGDTNLIYERLMSIKLDGWEVVFNEWKEEGILN